MRILNRYIRHAVIDAVVLVTLVLLGIECFMELIGQLPDVGHAHYNMGRVFLYVLTQLPADLYQLFPMAGFLGCLIGLGRLASSHQLIVMRASGVSIAEITGSVIRAALIMIVAVTLIGEAAAPKLQIYGIEMKAKAMARATGYQALGGVWLRDATSFIHIGAVNSDVEISDVTRFVINPRHVLISSDYAAKGYYVKGHWELNDVKTSQFTPEKVTKSTLPHLALNVVFDPKLLQQGQQNMIEQSITQLYQSIRYRHWAGLESSQYSFTFWQRIVQPLTTIVMICLGVPFIFGSLRSASMGLRLLTGIIIGFIFYMINQFFGPFVIVYPVPPVLIAIMPTMLFGIACVILLRRSN